MCRCGIAAIGDGTHSWVGYVLIDDDIFAPGDNRAGRVSVKPCPFDFLKALEKPF
jgi:hypothetical protein